MSFSRITWLTNYLIKTRGYQFYDHSITAWSTNTGNNLLSMLAALIASQSLVTLVAAAPAPTEKPEFVVNVPHTLYEDYPNEVESIKCYIAKDDKNACLNPSYETDNAVDFLAKHKQCKAINSKITVDFKHGNIVNVKNCPLEAFCYVRAGQCGEITKANLPELDRKYLASVNSFCYGVMQKGKCDYAMDPELCRQLYRNNVNAEQRRIREWEERQAYQQAEEVRKKEAQRVRKLQENADEEETEEKARQVKREAARGYYVNCRSNKESCCRALHLEKNWKWDWNSYHMCMSQPWTQN
jgi:hypothetical protein